METGLPDAVSKAYGEMLDAIANLQAAWVKEYQYQITCLERCYNEIEEMDEKYARLHQRWMQDNEQLRAVKSKIQALEELVTRKE